MNRQSCDTSKEGSKNYDSSKETLRKEQGNILGKGERQCRVYCLTDDDFYCQKQTLKRSYICFGHGRFSLISVLYESSLQLELHVPDYVNVQGSVLVCLILRTNLRLTQAVRVNNLGNDEKSCDPNRQ